VTNGVTNGVTNCVTQTCVHHRVTPPCLPAPSSICPWFVLSVCTIHKGVLLRIGVRSCHLGPPAPACLPTPACLQGHRELHPEPVSLGGRAKCAADAVAVAAAGGVLRGYTSARSLNKQHTRTHSHGTARHPHSGVAWHLMCKNVEAPPQATACPAPAQLVP